MMQRLALAVLLVCGATTAFVAPGHATTSRLSASMLDEQTEVEGEIATGAPKKKTKKVLGASSAMPEGYTPTGSSFQTSAKKSSSSSSSSAKPKAASWAGQFAGKPKASMVPFVARAPLLDGTHAGDGGFDPLGLAKDEDTLYVMMEAEVKHARLAMLGIIGWLAVENHAVLGPLAFGGRAPSLLNGGFTTQSFLSVLAFFALVGTYETQQTFGEKRVVKLDTAMGKLHHADLGGDAAAWQFGVAGDCDFDPAGLYPKTPEARKKMRDVELANGRLAMLAISFAAFYEPATGAPVTALAGPFLIFGTLAALGVSAIPPSMKKELGLPSF